jgi:hypothetical protein
MKRNRRLLLKTAKRIEEVPESYRQGEWVANDDRSPCGTVACLAGEIVICSEPSVKKGIVKLREVARTKEHVAGAAIRLAGLNEQDEETLFYHPRQWPNGIGRGFNKESQAGKAKAAAALLRYLADGGAV